MNKAIALFAVAFLAACTPPINTGATERALCEVWGESLPTRSRSDSAQTQSEIQAAYADFLNACPDWRHLLP